MISTTCAECCFKQMTGNVQTGCSLSILDRFRESGATLSDYEDETGTYSQVNKVCMYRRSEWDYSRDIHDDVFIKSTIVILHNQGDNLKQTLLDIANLDTPKPPNVIVCHTTDNLSEIYRLGTSLIDRKNFSCVHLVESTYDGAIFDEAFKRCKNGWVFFIDSGVTVQKDLLRALNHSVNYQMSGAIAVIGQVEAYMAVAYKVLHGKRGDISATLSTIPNATVSWNDTDEDYRVYTERQSSPI